MLMKIINTKIFPISVPKKTEFAVAYATRKAAESIVVCLFTDDGLEGYREAVPVKEITGEIKKEVYDKLIRFCQRIPGVNVNDHKQILEEAELYFVNQPSAIAAIDSALWDLQGKIANKPLYQLWGGDKEYCLASQSLGILPLDQTLLETKKYVDMKISHLKYKIGLNPTEDIKRIKAVRAQYPEIKIYLDANQGYSVSNALKVAESLFDCNIEFIEQPVPKDDLLGLLEVANKSPITIVADEAVQDLKSLEKLLSIGKVPMINVKLMKCGGPTSALKMIEVARKASIEVMIGCMIETRLGITTGLHLAQSSKIVKYIDLDGCWDLTLDIVSSGGAVLEDGKEYVLDRPGLGVKLDFNLLSSLAHKN